jgi:pyrimidine operon attenuation protein/uracil phosphoribosyltransferase
MTPGLRTCLYNVEQLMPVVDRMARQIDCLFSRQTPLVLMGVRRRGAPLADLLSQRLQSLCGRSPPTRVDVTLKRYADDLTLLHPDTQLTEAPNPQGWPLGHRILVVDDVFYSGHSLLKLLSHPSLQKATEIRSVCLVDRGCATLPLHADVVGLRIEVAPEDIVECHVPPYEKDFSIALLKPHRSRPNDQG